MTPQPVDLAAARAFLVDRYGAGVADVEVLGGGDWSRAFGFTLDGRGLVARFGRWRDDFEADLAAMAYDGPDLPVPEVLEIGDAFDGAYAVSQRHHGEFLDRLDVAAAGRALPAIIRMLDALRALPPRVSSMPWREQLRLGLVDEPGGRVSGWREVIAAHPDVDAVYVAGEAAFHDLLPACPDLRHVLHVDLLNRNVLVDVDAARITAVFDWGCTMSGDFLYEVAWFTFWSRFPVLAAFSSLDLGGVMRDHLSSARVETTDYDTRLDAYELHIALMHIAYNAFTNRLDAMREVTERTQALLASLR